MRIDKEIKAIKKENPKLFDEIVIHFGILRRINECANCGKKINDLNYNIQLCQKCREFYLNKNKRE
jgi:hypothetical protein